MNDTEVLFQYLKSILYDDHIKKPDFQQLKAENPKVLTISGKINRIYYEEVCLRR